MTPLLLLLTACVGPAAWSEASGKAAEDLDGDGASAGTDCDDADPTVHPDAAETCDGRDENCDGRIDEGVRQAFYVDRDEDGYGSKDVVYGCSPGAGRVSNSDDCDDRLGDAHPGAAEVCGDDVDQDCVPGAAACPLGGVYPLTRAESILEGDLSGDLLGHDLARAGDTEGDGGAGLWVASAWNDAGGTDAGSLYLVRSMPYGRSAVGDVSVAQLTGESPGDMAAGGFDGNGDVDGDGLMDVLVGASRSSRMASAGGAAYVLLGPFAGGGSLADAPIIVSGSLASQAFGNAVALLPDGDGDGLADLAMAAAADDAGGVDAGAVYVAYGAPGATMEDCAVKLLGEAADDSAGYSLRRAGDVNGDGLTDLLIGAPYHTGVANRSGRAYVVFSPVEGTRSLAEADLLLDGEAAQDVAGFEVADAGDVDGDGFADVYIGAPNQDGGAENGGAVYWVRGGRSGQLGLGEADGVYRGPGGFAGTSVGSAGDLDGDGVPDLVTGAREYDGGTGGAGAAFVLFMPRYGVVDLGKADAVLLGERAGDAMGDRAIGPGDLNGDGRDDLAVSADLASASSRASGLVSVWSGGRE